MAKTTRLARAVGIAVIAVGALPVAVLAAPPTHSTTPNVPSVFAPGEPCDDAMSFENSVLRGRDTVFAPAPDGSQRVLSRGSGVSTVTDLANGNRYDFQG